MVVPESLKMQIMEIAHDKFGGHLGFERTYERIAEHFFWKDMYKTLNIILNRVNHAIEVKVVAI